MSLLPTLLLALALGPQEPAGDSDVALDARRLAWSWHQEAPSAAQLVASWQESGQADPLLAAAARSLRGEEALLELLAAALADLTQDEQPSSGLLELLHAAPIVLDSALADRLRALRSGPAWRESCTLALLRAGGSADELDGFPAILGSALQQDWLPAAGSWASFLTDPELRAMLWPALIGKAVSSEAARELGAIDAAAWPAGDRLMLQIVLADAQAPTAASAAALWQGWLETPLPESAGIALQGALARHLPAAEPDFLASSLAAAEPARQADAISLLALIAPGPAAGVLRSVALDATRPSALRARAVNAVFRCGNERDVLALLSLLQAETAQPILQALMAGLRLQPVPDIAQRLEAMMPRLRTRLAGLAIELIILTGDARQRLHWLERLGPLQRSDQARIIQAAWATDPSPSLASWFEAQAASTDPAAMLRGRVGLQASRTPAEVAAFYRDRLREADTAQERQAVLQAARELRTDEALELLVDWLATEEGRRHPSSASWASLVVEEPAAARAFELWWDVAESLQPVQRDWAACHLADQDPSARAYLVERMPQVETAVQVRIMTALSSSPQPDDVGLALAWASRADAADPVRTRAAALLAQLAGQDATTASRAWEALETAAQADPLQVPRVWRALVRTWAETETRAAGRVALYEQLQTLPSAWRRILGQEFAIAVATAPDEAAASRALEQVRLAWSAETTPIDVSAAAAEDALSRAMPELLEAVTVLGALQDADIDEPLHAMLAALPRWHPDALAYAARALADPAPGFAAAARLRLRVTEAPQSWRFPPEEQDARTQAPWMLEANDAFAHLEAQRSEAGAFEQELLKLARQRWPRDRRAHLWSGWYALDAGSLAAAVRHFQLADDCSGWLPYARMEPRLGLALCSWQTDGSLVPMEELIDQLPQARDLLDNRAPDALRAALLDAGLLPSDQE